METDVDTGFVMDMSNEDLRIGYQLTRKGICIDLGNKKFNVNYPADVWNGFPVDVKKIIAENFVFLATHTLATILKKPQVNYDMNSPLFQSLFFDVVSQYILFCSESHTNDTVDMIKRFLNSRYYFTSYDAELPDYSPETEERSVNLFSFGKESLLCFALAEELGLNPVLLIFDEPEIQYNDPDTGELHNMYEIKHKDALIKKFASEFGKKVHRVDNGLGIIRYPETFNVDEPDLSFGTQLTEYALLSLPFNHHFKAKYVVVGNEASCSTEYLNKEGFLANPVYEQSNAWTFEITKMLSALAKNISVISLVEPIHEIAVVKVLHNRYPHYAKYQMSCFADSNTAESSRWCHHCSKCARVYSFFRALNIDPKIVGFKEEMFSIEKKNYFSLFESNKSLKPYDMVKGARDEMLFAFYLAYKNGAKGDLMELFKKNHLKEAESRSEELHNTFFGIHEAINIPDHIKGELMNIFKEELG